MAYVKFKRLFVLLCNKKYVLISQGKPYQLNIHIGDMTSKELNDWLLISAKAAKINMECEDALEEVSTIIKSSKK